MQPTESKTTINVFISYARADQELRKKLEEHLSSLKHSGKITIWQDQEIPLGADWKDQIDTHLDEADLILLLTSSSFIASNYCWNKEVQAALERHKAGTVRVVPIILRPVGWQNTPLGQLQALPAEAKPITLWENEDAAFKNVVDGIQEVVDDLLKGRVDNPISLAPKGRNAPEQPASGGEKPEELPFPRKRRSKGIVGTWSKARSLGYPLLLIIPVVLIASVIIFQPTIGKFVLGLPQTATVTVPPKSTPTTHPTETKTVPSTVMFRIDAAHTGYKPGETKINEGNVGGLHELWKYPIGTGVKEIYASPIVVDGVVYIQSHKGLYAFDASQCRQVPTNCQPLWHHSWESFLAGAGSTVAVANGLVYVGAYSSKIYAFDAAKCRQARGGECVPLWTYKTRGYVFASPTVVNGILYIGSRDHTFYAFDTARCSQAPTTCQPLWSYQTNGEIPSSAAADNSRVYVGSLDSNVYAFDLSCRSGCSPVATYHADGPVFATPALAYGKVYVSSQANKDKPVADNLFNTMFAFSATCRDDCQPLWRATSTGGNAAPAVADGLVYFSQGLLSVFDAFGASCPQQECKPLWVAKAGGYGSPLIANGLVFVTPGAKKVLVYKHEKTCSHLYPGSSNTCNPLWEGSLGEMSLSSPLVEDGVLYFADNDGYLYAYGL
jgi:outer membrane protein assembly factor BamB